MHPEHRIDEFTLDLSFTTTRLARREKAGLVSWISEELLPALDRLFSHYSPGNQVLRFETLEFDLGRLDARHYQQQIREQLLEQFTHLLKSQMLALDPRTLANSSLVPLVPDARAALQQLISYLSTGNITAHYAFNPTGRYGDGKDQPHYREKIHHQLFEQVIAQQDIAELLRQFPARDVLVARLVKQFNAAQRLVLLRQLAPQQVAQVQALLDLMEFVGQQQGFFSATIEPASEFSTAYAATAASPTSYFPSAASLTAAQVFASNPTALQQQLWQQVLLLALESPHATEAVWLAYLLDKLATSLVISKMQLREFLLAIPLPAAQAHPLTQLQTRIGQLIQTVDLHTRTQPHSATETSNLIADNTDSYVDTRKPLNYSLFLRKQEPLDQRNSSRSLIFMDTRVRGYDKKFIFQSFPGNAGVYAKQNSTAHLSAGSSPAELLPKDITNIPRTLLQQKIAQALVRADINSLQAIWPTLVAREPELLFVALQHYLPQAEIRQQLMMQLPLSIQADIIGILAADIKPLFLRLQQMADELVNAMSAQAGNENNFTYIDSALINGAEKVNSESPTHLQRRLWEIAVGLLLNHSPATVSAPNTKNPDIFLYQLIEHYARIGSLNAQWLQQLWRQVIQLSTSMYTGTIFSSASTAEKLVTVQDEATQPFSIHSSIESAATSPKAEPMFFEASISERSTVEPLAVASFGSDSFTAEPNTIHQQSVAQQTSETRISNQQTISAASPTNLSATPQPENALLHTASQQPNFDDISDHQLFDLCLRLKSGAVSWSQISFGVALSQRMIDSYIRLGHSATAENCRDFIAAINHQAVATHAPAEFYRAVLRALVADKLVDLEAIAIAIAKSPQAINAGENDSVQTLAANTAIATEFVRTDRVDAQGQIPNNQFNATGSDDSSAILRTSDSAEETAVPITNSTVTDNAHALSLDKSAVVPANIAAIAVSLVADTQLYKQLQQLRLPAAQWQQLCAAIIQQDTAVEISAGTDLLQAIHRFANRAIYFDLYYRHVISALLQQQPLNLELFANTANDNTQNTSLEVTPSTSTSSATNDLLVATNPLTAAASVYTSHNNDDDDDKDLLNIQSQIDTTKTVLLSNEDHSAVHKQNETRTQPSAIHAHVQSLLAAAQPVVYLQQLHLSNDQWQEICSELILHQATMNTDAAVDLLQSIKIFARQALNTASYYHKVVHALLQQQAIDLELFANAANNNTQNNSLEVTASTNTSSATDNLPMATSPRTTAASVYTNRNNDDDDKDLLNIQSQIDTTKTVLLSNEDHSAVHKQNETRTQPSAIHAHVQSLLTAAQPVVYLQQLHLSDDQWQEICSELILHQATMNTDAAVDLLQSIKIFARQALNTTSYYRKVVHALLQQQAIDLELFANAANNNTQNNSLELTTSTSTNSATNDLLVATNPRTTAASVYTNRNNDGSDKDLPKIQPQIELDKIEQLSNEDHSAVHEQRKSRIQHSTMNAYVQSLLAAAQPVVYLQQLHLSEDQWQEICNELIRHQATMENDAAVDLLQSIKTFARQALNTTSYYRKVVHALLQQQAINLELFANAANNNTQNNSLEVIASTNTSSATNDLLVATNPLTAAASVYTSHNNDDDDKDLLNIQSQIDTTKTVLLSNEDHSVVHEQNETKTQPSAIHAHVQSLLVAAQPVEYLQQLHLSNDQWQEFCSELILHQATMNTDAASDLLQSIKIFAQQALNTASYYRKVVHALLQQQAIDLELFANAANNNTQNNSLELTTSTSTSSATNDLLVATNPLTAAASVYTSHNNDDDDDKDLLNIQSQIDTTKTVLLSNEDHSAVHKQNETKTQPSAIHAHVQSLLVAAQPVEYLQQLHLSNDQWQEICNELIRHQAIMDNDATVDLLQSIKSFAQQALNTANYYRKVVHALLQQQAIDLELFANAEDANAPNNSLELTTSTSTSSATNDLLVATNPRTTAASVYTNRNNDDDKDLLNIQSQIELDKTEQLSNEDRSTVHEQNETKIQPSAVHAHVQSLLVAAQPVEFLQQLHLSNDQWQEICSELILHQATINTDAASDLLQSIKIFARQALNTASYYRKVVHALLQQQAIDLELFANAEDANAPNNSLEFTTSTSTSSVTDNLPMATSPRTTAASVYTSRNNDDDDKDLLNIQSQIELDKTEQLSNEDHSAVHEQNETKIQPSAIHAHVQSLLVAAQPVEYLQQLHLSNDQWQEFCSELILHQAIIENDAASALLKSIKTFARQALNTTSYYRKVVHALLQQQAIDLELFANASGDNAQTRVNETTNAATTTADLQKTQTQAINIHTTVNDQAAADPNVQFERNTDEPQKTQQPGMPLTINTPLLTGSADSLRKPVISLAQLLRVETTFAREQLLALQQHINFLLQHATTDIVNEWLELLSEAKHHSRLIREVPAHLLHQIVMRLQPATYPPLDALVKVVNEAIALLAVDSNSLALKLTKWEFIFHTLFVIRPVTLDKNHLTKILCQIFATAVGIDDVQRLINLAERRVALLTPPARQQPAMHLQDLQGAQKTAENTYTWEAGIPISNAGQVLAAAFMPRLFAMLELTQEGKFVHPAAADRAAHLVQFMVSGETRAPEYELTLNKILCGISTSLPISEGIEISEQEKNIIEQMLTSMIQHWKVLGSTSITGLRETFFQRQGWLVLEEDCWRLKVQERTFDMLLDRLPWSISLIKHSWMDKPLRVSWRDQS